MLSLLMTSVIVRITPAADNYVGLWLWPRVDDAVWSVSHFAVLPTAATQR